MKLSCPLFSSQALPSSEIAGSGLLNNLWWHRNTVFILQATAYKPVSQVLLVKRLLRPTDFILGAVPEAAAIRCQHLVDQHDRRRRGRIIQSEFELCVCDYDALLSGVVSSRRIELEGNLFDLVSDVFAYNFGGCRLLVWTLWQIIRDCTFLGTDVLVMLALFSLCARCPDGRVKLLALSQTFLYLRAMDCAILLVFTPCTTRNVSSNDRLNRYDLQLSDLHTTSLKGSCNI
jgi:hypothetical protein